ncbi:MAG: hypothetical protein DI551_05250 [Micavibrio aeruginosavorus]|uniref:Uncharacterized protein n=1 Tax=Micavibrio aeruginosavorus TaxID=349221 RepID=A0A2W5MYJ2_9BACT|nr:MAG: hypothetical protein DI551_05250 [Micavibrio aeruginosavorus]
MLEKLKQYLSNFSELFAKVAEGTKWAIALLYVKHATRIEDEKDALEISDKIKSKQLKIAAEPDLSPSSIRDRMRSGDL